MDKTATSRLCQALTSPHLFATSLLLILVDVFGLEVLNWDITTIHMELRDELNVTIPKVNDQKIQAALTAMNSDSVVHDPLAFSAVARAFCNMPVNEGLNTPLDPDLAAWCITELALLGVDDLKDGLSEDVRRYIGACLSYAGIHRLPRCLPQAILPETEADPAEASSLDPQIQSAFIRKNQEDAAGIDGYVSGRTHELLDQITRLPLSDRNNKSWAELYTKLKRSLAA